MTCFGTQRPSIETLVDGMSLTAGPFGTCSMEHHPSIKTFHHGILGRLVTWIEHSETVWFSIKTSQVGIWEQFIICMAYATAAHPSIKTFATGAILVTLEP